jgi:hypothetical protein
VNPQVAVLESRYAVLSDDQLSAKRAYQTKGFHSAARAFMIGSVEFVHNPRRATV